MKKIPPALKGMLNQLNDLTCHSGEVLGKKVGISRNAVWKYINLLNSYGVEIQSRQSTGYQLINPIILLDDKQIKKHIHNTSGIKLGKIETFTTLTSTNDHLKTQKTKEGQLVCCLSEHQTAGKGRLGRKWLSPFAANIYLSTLWQVNQDISHLSGLSLVIGLAIVAALKKQYHLKDLTVKWPNDILWQGKKLAGILIEIQAESYGVTRVIIGIGLNANMSMDQHIEQPWTSLGQIINRYIDRNEIVGAILETLLIYLEKFDTQGLSAFIKEWLANDALYDQSIQLIIGDQLHQGIAKGINAQGNLLLQLSTGEMKEYSAGEASIKKKVS